LNCMLISRSQGLLCKMTGVRLIMTVHMLDPTVGSGERRGLLIG
jgi:hypothetical protein